MSKQTSSDRAWSYKVARRRRVGLHVWIGSMVAALGVALILIEFLSRR